MRCCHRRALFDDVEILSATLINILPRLEKNEGDYHAVRGPGAPESVWRYPGRTAEPSSVTLLHACLICVRRVFPPLFTTCMHSAVRCTIYPGCLRDILAVRSLFQHVNLRRSPLEQLTNMQICRPVFQAGTRVNSRLRQMSVSVRAPVVV